MAEKVKEFFFTSRAMYIEVADDMYVPVCIENRGKSVLKTCGKYPANMSYHILNKEGRVICYEGGRKLLCKYIYTQTQQWRR